MQFIAAKNDVRIDAVNSACVFVLCIETYFIGYVQADKDKTGKAGCETCDVNQREGFVFQQISPGYFYVSLYHGYTL